MSAPTVLTKFCTGIQDAQVTGNGAIIATGGANATRRGFLYMPGVAYAPVVGNLLINYSFETGDPPDNWLNRGAGGSRAQSSDWSVGGTYSVKCTNFADQSHYIYQNISNPGDYSGKELVVGCWAKTSISQKTKIRLYCKDDGGESESFSDVHTGSGEGEWLTASLAIGTNCTSLIVLLYHSTSTTAAVFDVYFDEAVLVIGSSLDPIIYSNVSTVYDDGDFGTGAFSKAITELSADQDYRIRAYATNPNGTGYGGTVQARYKGGVFFGFMP